jgi:hypothetical protein
MNREKNALFLLTIGHSDHPLDRFLGRLLHWQRAA